MAHDSTHSNQGARAAEIAAGLCRTRERIAAAARGAGREPREIELLPVTKFHPVEELAILAELGVRAVGENREQEARAKAEQLPQLEFHMIGGLQRNKAHAMVRWASGLQSVDSARLATAVNRAMTRAVAEGTRPASLPDPLPCSVQWSVDGDPSRGGAVRETLPELIASMAELQHVELRGLMVVPPLAASAREVFEQARELTDELAREVGRPLKLSAGMSHDYELAIRCGADTVRVGTQIMGPRPLA